MRCKRCGAIYPLPINMQQSRITVVNSASECPCCGALNAIPDGQYEFVGGVLTTIKRLHPDTLRRLANVVRSARVERRGDRDLAEAICRQAPELRKFIPQDATQLANYLAVVVALLAVLLPRCDDSPRIHVKIDQIIINNTVQLLEQQNYDVDAIVKKRATRRQSAGCGR